MKIKEEAIIVIDFQE